MKLKKSIAYLTAASIMFGALSINADAVLSFPSKEEAHPGASTAGNWLVQVYNIGQEADGKLATDYGLDITAIAKVEVTLVVEEEYRETFEGNIGGSVIFSSNGDNFTDEEWAKYNWPTNEWWGVYDEELGLDTIADTKECLSEKIADYTYKITYNVPVEDRFLAKAECAQVGIQEWGDTENYLYVDKLACFDESGRMMISYDRKGYPTVPATAMELDKDSDTIYFDENVALTAKFTPSGATDKITWTSSDENVAIVKDGVVYGVSEGTATITATIDSWAAGGIPITDTFEVTVEGYKDDYANGDFNTVKPEETTDEDFTEAEPEEEISQEPDTNKVHVHKQGKKWRFYKLVKEEELQGKKNAVMFIKSDKNKNVIRIKSKNAFAAVNGVKAPEGYVYVSFTITDVPEDVNFTFTDIVLE